MGQSSIATSHGSLKAHKGIKVMVKNDVLTTWQRKWLYMTKSVAIAILDMEHFGSSGVASFD